MPSKISVVCLSIILFFSGCGYTRKTVLPQDIKTIYVRTVLNKVPVEEIYVYNPGLEMGLTKAIIRRLNKDGNLRVVSSEAEADAILKTDLVRFQQEGLRFDNLERVEEYRVFMVVALKLLNAKTKETIWEEPAFSGDAEYFVSDVRSVGREDGTQRALERLARNIVDRIVEDW